HMRLARPALWFVFMTCPLGSAEISLADFPLTRVVELKGATFHVQGVDIDSTRVWVTSVDAQSRTGYLQEFSLTTGELLRKTGIGDGVRFHPGGISADSTSLWIPIAEYRRDTSSAIDWLDPADFHLIRRVEAGKTDRGEPYTREGMAIGTEELLLLPEDAPSRLFIFHLPPSLKTR